MGYPMTWNRLVNRNGLQGGYDGTGVDDHRMRVVAGDLRRFAHDQRDGQHLLSFATQAGVRPDQVQVVLDLLFEGEPDRSAWLPPA